MRKLALTLAAVAATGLAATAQADVVIEIDHSWEGAVGQFFYNVGDLQGTITGMSVDATLTSGDELAWASDLGVMLIAGDSTADPYLTQVGGFSDFGADEFHRSWNVTDENPLQATVILDTPIDASMVSVFIGNFYSFNFLTFWEGTITLHGASVVPAPGALALLGLAGVAGAPRRRRA